MKEKMQIMGYLRVCELFSALCFGVKEIYIFLLKLAWYLYIIYLKIPMSLSENKGQYAWIFMSYIVSYFAEFGLVEYYRIWATTTKLRIVAAYNGLFSTEVLMNYCQHKPYLWLMVHLGNEISMQFIYEVNSTSLTNGTVGH